MFLAWRRLGKASIDLTLGPVLPLFWHPIFFSCPFGCPFLDVPGLKTGRKGFNWFYRWELFYLCFDIQCSLGCQLVTILATICKSFFTCEDKWRKKKLSIRYYAKLRKDQSLPHPKIVKCQMIFYNQLQKTPPIWASFIGMLYTQSCPPLQLFSVSRIAYFLQKARPNRKKSG